MTGPDGLIAVGSGAALLGLAALVWWRVWLANREVTTDRQEFTKEQRESASAQIGRAEAERDYYAESLIAARASLDEAQARIRHLETFIRDHGLVPPDPVALP